MADNSNIINLSIGSQCESITQAVTSGAPVELGPLTDASGHLIYDESSALYDTGSGNFLIIGVSETVTNVTLTCPNSATPSLQNSKRVITINNWVGNPQTTTVATINPTTGTTSLNSYKIVTNALDLRGFGFFIRYDSRFNQTRKERLIVNARGGSISGGYGSTGTKLHKPTSVAGTVNALFSGANDYQMEIASAGELIANKIESEIFEATENTYQYECTSKRMLQNIKLKQGDSGSYRTLGYSDVIWKLTYNIAGYNAGTKIALRALGKTGGPYYLNQARNAQVDWSLGTTVSSDIGQFRLGQFLSGTTIGLGLADFTTSPDSNGIVNAHNNLGYLIFDVNGKGYVRFTGVSGTEFYEFQDLTAGLAKTTIGSTIMMFRHKYNCATDANVFLKFDQSAFYSGGNMKSLTTPVFELNDYFMEADPRSAFQYLFIDQGLFDATQPQSNIYQWTVSLNGIIGNNTVYRINAATGGENTLTLASISGLKPGMIFRMSVAFGGLNTSTDYFVRTINPATNKITLTTTPATGNIETSTITSITTATPATGTIINLTLKDIPSRSNIYIAPPNIVLATWGSGIGMPAGQGWLTVRESAASSNLALVYYAGKSGANDQFYYLNVPDISSCPSKSGSTWTSKPSNFGMNPSVYSSLNSIPGNAYMLRCVRCSSAPTGGGFCQDDGLQIVTSVSTKFNYNV